MVFVKLRRGSNTCSVDGAAGMSILSTVSPICFINSRLEVNKFTYLPILGEGGYCIDNNEYL